MELQEALRYEMELLDIENDVNNILESYSQDAGVVTEISEYKIRNMILAIKYHQEEQDKLDEMKKVVMAQWTNKIDAKKKQIKQLRDIVLTWLEQSNTKKLSLDVATLSEKNTKYALDLKNTDESKEAVAAFLQQTNSLNQYLKEPEIDYDAFLGDLKKAVEEQSKLQIQQMIEHETAQLEAGKKLTAKRVAEIEKECTETKMKEFSEIYSQFTELKQPTKSLSIRFNK